MKLSDQSDIVARLSRGDINMPNFAGFPIDSQIAEVFFEVAVYRLLRTEPRILTSNLIHHRLPVEHAGNWPEPPTDITGRRLFVFEKAAGEKDVWKDLNPDQQVRFYFIDLKPIPFNWIPLIFSLGLPSRAGCWYPCITVRIQPPAPLC